MAHWHISLVEALLTHHTGDIGLESVLLGAAAVLVGLNPLK